MTRTDTVDTVFFLFIILNSDQAVLMPEDILRKSLMRREHVNESEIL
jgi:hypothetical protein